MHPETEALRDRVRRQRVEVDALLAELDDDAFHRRPAEGKWSPGQHLAHMAVVNVPYVRAIEGAVAKARSKGWTLDDGSFRTSRLGRAFIAYMAPPPKRRVRTFRSMRPPEDPGLVDRAETEAAFRGAHDALLTALDGAGTCDLGRATVASPFLPVPFPRYPAHEVVGIVLAHTDRHVWLIREGLGGGS